MLTFFAVEKKRILKFLLENPEKEIKIREIARVLNSSPAYVSRIVKILITKKIIKNNKIDLTNSLTKALKIFLNVEKLAEYKIIERIVSLNPISAGIYGSWANGTNHEDSDLDIWVKFEKHPGEMKIASLSGKIRRVVGNVQILVLTKEKIEMLKKDDPIFYYSLVFGSIIIRGEGIE